MMEKVLSCFIDESGDFSPYELHCPFYYVAMVLHDQSKDIGRQISGMEERAANRGYPRHAIHTGPLIRRENVYAMSAMEERRRLFNLLYYFTVQLPIQYICVNISKSECSDCIDQTAKLSKRISMEIQAHEAYWRQFDKIIVYYDNGQMQLTKIITSVFNTLFTNVEMRKVKPADYKLFQVSDLICTMEMINDKALRNMMTKSELEFFDNARSFKKNYYKKISGKRLV